MSKLDNIIELMDAHHFRNLKEICEIPAHRSAIEAIINEQPSEEIVQTQSDTDVGQWRVGDIAYHKDYGNVTKLSIDHLRIFINKGADDWVNIDAERRTMQAEIDRLKAQVEGL